MLTLGFVLFSRSLSIERLSTAWASPTLPILSLRLGKLISHDKKKKSLLVKISVRNVLSYQVPEALYSPYYVKSPTYVKQISHIEVYICFPFPAISLSSHLKWFNSWPYSWPNGTSTVMAHLTP